MNQPQPVHPLQMAIMAVLLVATVGYDVYGAITGQGFVGYLLLLQMNWWGWGSTKLAMVMAVVVELVPLALIAVGLEQFFKRQRRQA